MSAPDGMTPDPDKPIAFIVTHAVEAGEEQRYKDRLADIHDSVGSFHGYLDREIFLP
jgi:antibiotic biosynthesis monooxygenase (ABM) superfamily enzyme